VLVTVLCDVDLKQIVVQPLLNLLVARKAVLLLYTLEMGEVTQNCHIAEPRDYFD
jgi:hypothetical protein